MFCYKSYHKFMHFEFKGVRRFLSKLRRKKGFPVPMDFNIPIFHAKYDGSGKENLE